MESIFLYTFLILIVINVEDFSKQNIWEIVINILNASDLMLVEA